MTGTANLASGKIEDHDWVPLAMEDLMEHDDEVLCAIQGRQEASPDCDLEDLDAGVAAVEHPPSPISDAVAASFVGSIVFLRFGPFVFRKKFTRNSDVEKRKLEVRYPFHRDPL